MKLGRQIPQFSHLAFKIICKCLSYLFMDRWIDTEIFTEINHLAYWDLYEVKVVTQLVKIIYSKTPLNPKKGKGKPEKGSGAVTKKGEQVWGEIEVSWALNLFHNSNCRENRSLLSLVCVWFCSIEYISITIRLVCVYTKDHQLTIYRTNNLKIKCSDHNNKNGYCKFAFFLLFIIL